ncbi:MAG: serine/threonine-protein phosphatase [Chloroflexi bacterium]|nr:serine/threonine-protein phosphatase [Chloroflexota bacterium]
MNESATYSEEENKQDMDTSSDVEKNDLETIFPDLPESEDIDEIRETEELPPLIVPGVKTILTDNNRSIEKPEAIIQVAKRCDVGARERNEDSCLIFSSESGGHFSMMPFGLYIVADGMGGHTNGHVASKIASRMAANHILKEIYLPLLVNDGPPQVGIRDVLVDAVQAANTAVFQDEPEIDSGTTLTVALLLGNRLYVAHVGDSRLYLHTPEKFEAVTNDHSLVQRLQDVGQLTAEEATIYRYRNVLLRAVGQGDEVEIDTYMRLLPKKGTLLLCSDGLCGFVTDDVMDNILKLDEPLQQKVHDLYEAAMTANSNDNVTVILVNFAL